MSLSSVLTEVSTKTTAAGIVYADPDLHQMSFTAGEIDNLGSSNPDAAGNYYSSFGGNIAGLQGDGNSNVSTHRNLFVDTSSDAYDPYTGEQEAVRCDYLDNASYSKNNLRFELATRRKEIYYRVMIKFEAGYITPMIQHKCHKFYESGGTGNDANTFTGRVNPISTNQNGVLVSTPYVYPITQYGPGQVEKAYTQYTSVETANRVNDHFNNKSSLTGTDWVVGLPIGEWFELIYHHVFDESAGDGGMQEMWLNGKKCQKAINIINLGGVLFPNVIEWLHEKDFDTSQISAGDDVSKKMWLKKFDVSTNPIQPLINTGWPWVVV